MTKYEHVRIDGIEFKPGEGWFLIRGQDRFAPAAIEAYAELVRDSVPIDALSEVRNLADQIRWWQGEHPEFVKTPD
jgi:hypothetical protein